jgi:hypothetical protein
MIRWQDDSDFVRWMYSRNYLLVDPSDGKIKHHFTGDGIILYMYEAWCAGLASQKVEK